VNLQCPDLTTQVNGFNLNCPEETIGDANSNTVVDQTEIGPGAALLEGKSTSARAGNQCQKYTVPDVENKKTVVSNGYADSDEKAKTTYKGGRGKVFDLCGEVYINESVCLNACSASKGCDDITAKKITSKYTRTADSIAEVNDSAACSDDGYYCGCTCCGADQS